MRRSGWGPRLDEHFTRAASTWIFLTLLLCNQVQAISKPFTNSSMPELRPTFFINLDMATVICQHSPEPTDLHIHEISILCDGNKDCFENPAIHDESFPYCEKKCNSTCNGRGACLYDGHGPQCFCNQGFSGPACEIIDVNECTTKPCHWLAHCQNTVGSFECKCLPGFEGDGFSCADIDECETGIAKCPSNSACVNLPGAHFCNCTQGFSPMGNPLERCEDIDECARGLFECPANQLCQNTIGGYDCVDECNGGYRKSEGKCVDIDECSQGSPCHPRAFCLNHEGTYECSCEKGFMGDGHLCEPVIRDCRIDRDVCDRHAFCVSSHGNCQCKAGYMGDGTICEDVNECETNPNQCSEGRCVNVIGGFICCNEDKDDQRCIQDNFYYCAGGCGKNAICKNETCQCFDGYEGDPNHECHDINECSQAETCKGVGEWCVNLEGSFHCCDPKSEHQHCGKTPSILFSSDQESESVSKSSSAAVNAGIAKYESGGSEQSQSGGFIIEEFGPNWNIETTQNCTKYCPALSECIDGKCKCIKGFQGNPSIGCVDIDECALGLAECNSTLDSSVWCVNEEGGYRCCTLGDTGNCLGLVLSKDGFELTPKESSSELTKVKSESVSNGIKKAEGFGAGADRGKEDESGSARSQGKAGFGEGFIERGEKKESSSGGWIKGIEDDDQGKTRSGEEKEEDLSKPVEGEFGLIITADGIRETNKTNDEKLDKLMGTLNGLSSTLETTTVPLILSTVSQRGISSTGVPISEIAVITAVSGSKINEEKIESTTQSLKGSSLNETEKDGGKSSTSASIKVVIHESGGSVNRSSGGNIKLIDVDDEKNPGNVTITFTENTISPLEVDVKPQPGEVGLEISNVSTKPPQITVDGEDNESEETNDQKHRSSTTSTTGRPSVTDDHDMLTPDEGEMGLEIKGNQVTTVPTTLTTTQPDLVLTASPTKAIPLNVSKESTLGSSTTIESPSTTQTSASVQTTTQKQAGPDIAIDSKEEGDQTGKDGKISKKPGKIVVSIGPSSTTTTSTASTSATVSTSTSTFSPTKSSSSSTTTSTSTAITIPTATTVSKITSKSEPTTPTKPILSTISEKTETSKITIKMTEISSSETSVSTSTPKFSTTSNQVTDKLAGSTTQAPTTVPKLQSSSHGQTTDEALITTKTSLTKATPEPIETSSNAAIEKVTEEATVSPAVVRLTSGITTISLPSTKEKPSTDSKSVDSTTEQPRSSPTTNGVTTKGVTSTTKSSEPTTISKKTSKTPVTETTSIFELTAQPTGSTTLSPTTTKTEETVGTTEGMSGLGLEITKLTTPSIGIEIIKESSKDISTLSPTSTTAFVSTNEPAQKITSVATEKPLVSTWTPISTQEPTSTTVKTPETDASASTLSPSSKVETSTINVRGPFERSESSIESSTETTQIPLIVTTLKETVKPMIQTISTSSTSSKPPAEATIVPKIKKCTSSDKCGIDAYCERRSGGCKCHPGFKGDPPEQPCIDINECAEILHDCHETARCHNFVGGFKCFCPIGFRQQPDGSCEDINECQESAGGCCSGNATCVNSPGTYECQCNKGFVGDGYKCIPIQKRACTVDEYKTAGCGSNHLCMIDNLGKKDCNECKTGFEMRPNGSCVDVDECSDRNMNMCSEWATCHNTNGSYTCKCQQGYMGDGFMCKDIDECGQSPVPCHASAQCTNLNGSFTCSCPSDWIGDGKKACINPLSRKCENLVEACGTAEHMTCLSARIYDGSVESICECEANYRWNAVTGKCEDIDECMEDRHDCDPSNSHCANFAGGYECVCMDGYEGRGGVCVDIDECKMGTSGCHHMAMCINRAGSCGCQCMHGFTGDGTECLVMPSNTTTEQPSTEPTSIFKETKPTTRIFEREHETTTEEGSEEERQCPEIWMRNCSLYNKKCEVDLEENPQCSSCIPGYQPSINETCIPINGKGGCRVDSCDRHADCQEIPPNEHRCSCKLGYIGDGRKCDDVDECSVPGVCAMEARCVNKDGSFDCLCSPGFTGNGFFCTLLVDHEDNVTLPRPNCLLDAGLCHPYAKCSLNGSCVCFDGFEGDGIKVCRSLHLSTKTTTRAQTSSGSQTSKASPTSFTTKVTIGLGSSSSTPKPGTIGEQLPILKVTQQSTVAPLVATFSTTHRSIPDLTRSNETSQSIQVTTTSIPKNLTEISSQPIASTQSTVNINPESRTSQSNQQTMTIGTTQQPITSTTNQEASKNSQSMQQQTATEKSTTKAELFLSTMLTKGTDVNTSTTTTTTPIISTSEVVMKSQGSNTTNISLQTTTTISKLLIPGKTTIFIDNPETTNSATHPTQLNLTTIEPLPTSSISSTSAPSKVTSSRENLVINQETTTPILSKETSSPVLSTHGPDLMKTTTSSPSSMPTTKSTTTVKKINPTTTSETTTATAPTTASTTTSATAKTTTETLTTKTITAGVSVKTTSSTPTTTPTSTTTAEATTTTHTVTETTAKTTDASTSKTATTTATAAAKTTASATNERKATATTTAPEAITKTENTTTTATTTAAGTRRATATTETTTATTTASTATPTETKATVATTMTSTTATTTTKTDIITTATSEATTPITAVTTGTTVATVTSRKQPSASSKTSSSTTKISVEQNDKTSTFKTTTIRTSIGPSTVPPVIGTLDPHETSAISTTTSGKSLETPGSKPTSVEPTTTNQPAEKKSKTTGSDLLIAKTSTISLTTEIQTNPPDTTPVTITSEKGASSGLEPSTTTKFIWKESSMAPKTTTEMTRNHSIRLITGTPEGVSSQRSSMMPILITASIPAIMGTRPSKTQTKTTPTPERTTTINHRDGVVVITGQKGSTRHYGTVYYGCETRAPRPQPRRNATTMPPNVTGAISGAKRCTADDRSACHSLALCEPDGVCRCKSGYEGDGYQTCTKTPTIDCVDDPSVCDIRAECNVNRRRCECSIGHIGDGIICAPDPQDCVIRQNLCSAEALCVGRRCQCQHGYTGDGIVCVSIHERGTNATACDSNSHFDGNVCKCNVGYLGNGLCCVADPRDCTHFPGICHENAFCQKDERSCRCNHGFQGNGISCLPLRSCRTTPTLCHRDAICLPSGDCLCKEGYVGDGLSCKRRGFIGHRDNQVSDTPSACGNLCNVESELCIDAKCECKHGFERTNGKCLDVNECLLDQPCHQLASCKNLDGSYECTCPDGYHGDGKSCLENVKLGELQVLCEPGQMTLLLENGTELNDGRIFVRGQSENPHCTKQFSAFHNEVKPYRFVVPFEHCNVRMEEKDTIAVTVVVQKHPMFITALSDAYDLRCTYPMGVREVESHVNVSDMVPSLTLSDESTGPLCTLTVTNEQAETVNSAMVGQSLHLTLTVEPSQSYSILPKNCFAINIETGERYSLTDRWGCAIDAELFPEWTRVLPSRTQVLFRTFKWPDSSMIRFQCDCSACLGDCPPVDCERRRQVAQRLFRFRRARNTAGSQSQVMEDSLMVNEALLEQSEENKLNGSLINSPRIAFTRLIAVHEDNDRLVPANPRRLISPEVLRESLAVDEDGVSLRTTMLALSSVLFLACLSVLVFITLRYRQKKLSRNYPSLPSLNSKILN